ncbi:uncharacterized protein LOC144036315 [Vanacampus margaritifer]
MMMMVTTRLMPKLQRTRGGSFDHVLRPQRLAVLAPENVVHNRALLRTRTLIRTTTKSILSPMDILRRSGYNLTTEKVIRTVFYPQKTAKIADRAHNDVPLQRRQRELQLRVTLLRVSKIKVQGPVDPRKKIPKILAGMKQAGSQTHSPLLRSQDREVPQQS